MNKFDSYEDDDFVYTEKWKPHYFRLLTGHERSDNLFADFAIEIDKEVHINLDEYEITSESTDYGNYVVTMVSLDRRHCVVGICNDYQKKNSMFEIIAW